MINQRGYSNRYPLKKYNFKMFNLFYHFFVLHILFNVKARPAHSTFQFDCITNQFAFLNQV